MLLHARVGKNREKSRRDVYIAELPRIFTSASVKRPRQCRDLQQGDEPVWGAEDGIGRCVGGVVG